MIVKMQKVIEEIKDGKRKDMYDVNFSLEEYLYEVSEDISFLEYLLKNNIRLNSLDVKNFKNSIKIAYIYAKNDKDLHNFELDENDLFSTYQGERYIDFFAKKKKLTNNMIRAVKNNIEIIDIIIDSNEQHLSYYTSDELIEKLITKDLNGDYPIEKYFDEDIVIRNLIRLTNKPQEITALLNKHKRRDLLKELNENVLMYKISENQTILNYLLSNNIVPNFLINIPQNIDFINYLRRNNLYEYLKKASENVLLMEVDKDKTLLEEILEKDNITKLDTPIYNKKTVSILYKKNRLDLIINCYDDILLTPVGKIFEDKLVSEDTLLIDYMIDKGLNPISKNHVISSGNLIRLLCNRGYYEFSSVKLDSEKLLMKLDNGELLINNLLQRNCNINFRDGSFKDEKLARILYEKGKYDLLVQANLDVLLKTVDNKNTYLDCILEAIKSQKIKFSLNKISLDKCSVNSIAKLYLTIAKHGMIEYLPDLKEKDLLEKYNGKTLLDELLDLDSELTLNEVISSSVKSKMKIAIIIKSRGLKQDTIDVPLKQRHYTKKYLENFQNALGIGPLLSEGEILLKKLEELFLSDGQSDPSLVSTLINGYRNALIVNYQVNVQELRNLVKIKEKNLKRFMYIKCKNETFFDCDTGSVYCAYPIVESVLHETGHALHYYLAQNSIPYQYNYIREKVRNNPETLKKVESYSIKYNQLRERMSFLAEEKYASFFEKYFDSNKKYEITQFLNKSLIERKYKFKSLGLSEESLDIILNNTFTIEEYIKQQKKVFISEYTGHMMRCEFGSFMVIGDILDAIYEGELTSGFLKNELGEEIARTAGHGISYYYDTNRGFAEMVANFASISKSSESKDLLDLLRSIIGDELYNMLSSFYYDDILYLQEEETKKI